MKFNNGHRDVNIISKKEGNTGWILTDDEHVNWYRNPSWDREGKMSFYIMDSSKGRDLLLTEEDIEAISGGSKSRYQIDWVDGCYRIVDRETGKTFCGYNFMGGADWDSGDFYNYLTREEAEQIVSDLESADEPAEKEETDMVNEAIQMMNERYLPGIKKNLEKQETGDHFTITVNEYELDILLALVNDKIREYHGEWYDATHEKPLHDSVTDYAYELSLTERHLQTMAKLSGKLEKAEEVA